MARDGWSEMKLGDFVTLQRGHDLPEQDRHPGTVPILGSFGITGYHNTAKTRGPGVTVGRSGASFGIVNYSPVDFWPLNTALYVKDFHANDAKFAYYFLKTIDFKRYNSGSAQPSLNRNHVHPLPVQIPPLPEQKAIARILGTLDDKIELNRRMNETREGMARALFKSWFVDFDPVRAKMDGRPVPGLDAATAALFPDGFEHVDGELVPKGWRYVSIRDVTEQLYDGPHATPPEADEGGVFLGIKNLTGTQIDLSDLRYISEADWPRWTRRVTPSSGDIVFTYEATLGYFAIIPTGLRCCLGRRLALIRPKPGAEFSHFLFHTFTASPFQQLLVERSVHGSTVDRIPLLQFPEFRILWPTQKMRERFETFVTPLWSRIHRNQTGIAALTAIRDSLLPKLLSGELRPAVTTQCHTKQRNESDHVDSHSRFS